MKKLLLLALLVPLTVTAVPTQPYTEFVWVAPTTNIDGSPLTDLAGYILYCGPSTGDYTLTSDVPVPALSQTFIAAGIPDGIFYCAQTAYNTARQEGPYSVEIGPFTLAGGVIQVIVPGAPGFGVR